MRNKPYLNKMAVIVLGLSTVQQLIVASSNLWLVETTKALSAGKPFLGNLSLYVGSLFLPYLPGALALVVFQLWVSESQFRFWDGYQSRLFGKIGIWNSDRHKSLKLPLIVKEGPNWIESMCQWLYGTFDSFLNCLLNIVVLAALIKIQLLVAFAIGAGLSCVAIVMQKNYLGRLAETLENDRADLTHATQNIWDNVLIGNRINAGHWRGRLLSCYQAFRISTLRHERFNQVISVVIAFLSNAPVFVCFFYYICQPGVSNAQILSSIVLLPRLFQIVNSSHYFLWQMTQAGSLFARERFITSQLNEGESKELAARIRPDRLRIESAAGESLTATEILNQLPSHGRFTVRGENGAGKSSLMMHVKSQLGEGAFYLPAKSDLLFDRPIEGSTGQRLSQIMEILAQAGSRLVLLLDEWDANLDAENTARISQLIERISRTNLVLEVRHL